MNKRYQVFVSSTYEDLKDERKEVMQALLEMNCIPCGMELFPASNEDQWTFIKGVIDDCDYYVLILGGRYGSTNSASMGYTEMEYRYAVEIGKPVAAFVIEDTQKLIGEKIEGTDEGKEKLRDFREFVQQKLTKYWTNKDDLAGAVSRSMNNLIRQNPTIGWVKADKIVDEKSLKEILKLKNENEELKSKINTLEIHAPLGAEELSSGNDSIDVDVNFRFASDGKIKIKKVPFSMTWNQIFSIVAPFMTNEASEKNIERYLVEGIQNQYKEEFKTIKDQLNVKLSNITIAKYRFQEIKVQLKALGLMKQSDKKRSVKDTDGYWGLTLYGDTVMTQLLAIKKSDDPEWTLDDNEHLVEVTQTL